MHGSAPEEKMPPEQEAKILSFETKNVESVMILAKNASEFGVE